MTRPDRSVIERLQRVAADMAGRTTPFVRDEWYCAGLSSEFGPRLLARRILGDAIVFHRTSAGAVVALEDRCAHRSFPLSKGTLVDDHIVCGYHGFRYDVRGDCVRVPSMARPPRHIGVRDYPVRELGRTVWIWMGDAPPPDGDGPPVQPWMTRTSHPGMVGALHLRANYVGLHENLLDLTHIEYLHAATLGQGAAGMAAAPYETVIDGERISVVRRVDHARLAPVFADTTGLGDIPDATRVTSTTYRSPAFEEVSATYFDASLPEAGRREFEVRTAHLITPETQSTTHYFIDHTWNWAIDDPRLLEVMRRGLFDAFEEDVAGLALVERTLAERDGDPSFHEASVASDAAAVALRRLLLARVRREAAARGA